MLLAGAAFGVQYGTFLVVVGSTLSTLFCSLLARAMARTRYERRMLRGSPHLAALNTALGTEPFRLVLLLRLSTFVPFTWSSYLVGLSHADMPRLLAATAIGSAPNSLAYVSSGALGAEASSRERERDHGREGAEAAPRLRCRDSDEIALRDGATLIKRWLWLAGRQPTRRFSFSAPSPPSSPQRSSAALPRMQCAREAPHATAEPPHTRVHALTHHAALAREALHVERHGALLPTTHCCLA